MGFGYERGTILYRQSRWKLAAEEFRRELAESPGSGNTHAMLGLSLMYDRQIAAATYEMELAVTSSPDDAFVHYATACLVIHTRGVVKRMRFKERVAMIKERNRKIRSQPDFPSLKGVWNPLRRWRIAIEQSRRLRQARTSPLSYLVNARTHLLEAIRLNPRSHSFFQLLAGIEQDLGNWNACLTAAERGLAINPLAQQCAVFRSRALLALGERGAAGKSIDIAIAHNPENAMAHLQRGWFILQTGETNIAEDHFRNALRISPADSSARFGLRLSGFAAFPPMRPLVRFALAHADSQPLGLYRWGLLNCVLATGVSLYALKDARISLLTMFSDVIGMLVGVSWLSILAYVPVRRIALMMVRRGTAFPPSQIVGAFATVVWIAFLTAGAILCPALFGDPPWSSAAPLIVVLLPPLPLAIVSGWQRFRNRARRAAVDARPAAAAEITNL